MPIAITIPLVHDCSQLLTNRRLNLPTEDIAPDTLAHPQNRYNNKPSKQGHPLKNTKKKESRKNGYRYWLITQLLMGQVRVILIAVPPKTFRGATYRLLVPSVRPSPSCVLLSCEVHRPTCCTHYLSNTNRHDLRALQRRSSPVIPYGPPCTVQHDTGAIPVKHVQPRLIAHRRRLMACCLIW